MLTSAYIPRKARSRRKTQGYILLTLMLFVALLTLAMVTLVPVLKFQIQREQEEEMVHRGVQYARAVRRYFRKFGAYPASIDQLQSAQNLRFLRKRYKDPINGADFRILRITDVRFGPAQGLQGGQNLAQSVNAPFNPGTSADQNPTNNSVSPATGASTPDESAAGAAAGSTQSGGGTPPSGNAGTTLPFTAVSGQPTTIQAFGGAGVVGVASTSEKESIRVYNKKNHYNDWQFVYDPRLEQQMPGQMQPGATQINPVGGSTPGQFNPAGPGQMNPAGPGQMNPPPASGPPRSQ